MAKRSRKQKVAARDRYRVEVDERTAENLDLDAVQRKAPVEEYLVAQASRNYDAIVNSRMSLDYVIRLRGGSMR